LAYPVVVVDVVTCLLRKHLIRTIAPEQLLLGFRSLV